MREPPFSYHDIGDVFDGRIHGSMQGTALPRHAVPYVVPCANPCAVPETLDFANKYTPISMPLGAAWVVTGVAGRDRDDTRSPLTKSEPGRVPRVAPQSLTAASTNLDEEVL
jgi:hypothetical protein